MALLNPLYLIAMTAPPIMLGFVWWGWFCDRRLRSSKWRAWIFFSGLCAGTLNIAVWWAWVAWLQLHYTPDSWKVRDVVRPALDSDRHPVRYHVNSSQ